MSPRYPRATAAAEAVAVISAQAVEVTAAMEDIFKQFVRRR